MKKKDPTSHRIIEKRRRDRMNNCLADLSKLIPVHYMKKGRGRIEKTEIIEMAIKHLKDLMELSKAHQKQQQQQQQQVVQNVQQQQQQTQNDISDQMTSSESKFPTCLSSSTSSMSPFAPRPSSERFDGTALMLMNQDDLQTTKNNPITIDNRGAQLHLRRQTTTGYLGVDSIATAQAGSAQMNGFISAQDVQHLANVNKTTSKEIKIEPSSSASSANTSATNLGTVAAAGSTTSTAEAVSAMINGTLSPASSSATKSYYNHYHASSNHHHHHHHHHHGNSGNSTTSTSISNNDGTTSSNASGNHHHNHKYRSSANLSSSTSSGSDSSGSSSSLGSSYGAGGGGNKSSNGESSSGHRSAGSSSSMRTSCSSSSVTAMNTGINMSGLVVDRGTTTSLHNITGNIDNNHNNSGLKSISSDPMVAGSAKQSTSLYPTGAGSLPQPGPVPMIITATNSLNHNGPLECCACGARIITLNHANNNSGSNSDSSISSNDNLSISPNNQSDTNSMDYSCKTPNVKRETGWMDSNNLTSEPARARLNGQSNGDTSSLSSSMSSSNSNSPPSSSSSSSSSSAWYKKAWLVRSFSRSSAMR